MMTTFLILLGGCATQRVAPKFAGKGQPPVSRIFFGFNKAEIRREHQEELGQLREWMKKRPKTVLLVEGHTDSIGSSGYNLQLGDRRAREVKVNLSKDADFSRRLVIVSKGESRPVKTNTTRSGRAENRRVEFLPILGGNL